MRSERKWFKRRVHRSVEVCGCDPIARAETRHDRYQVEMLKAQPIRAI